MSGTLDDLIARLEAATEGSRDLDDAVALVVLGAGAGVPAYTRSIDAAKTLVPKGCPVDLHIGPGAMANDAVIYVPRKSRDEQGRRVTTFEPFEARSVHWNSPPLALCIASLKARQAQPCGHSGR